MRDIAHLNKTINKMTEIFPLKKTLEELLEQQKLNTLQNNRETINNMIHNSNSKIRIDLVVVYMMNPQDIMNSNSINNKIENHTNKHNNKFHIINIKERKQPKLIMKEMNKALSVKDKEEVDKAVT